MKRILCFILCILLLSNTCFAYTDASDWAKEELLKAEEYSLIPGVLSESNISKPINRLEFATICVKLYEAVKGVKVEKVSENPFSDTDDSEILKAYSLGITTGTSTTTFEPKRLISREQAATMLARAYGVIKDEPVIAISTKKFTDNNSLSDWSIESVYFMAGNGFIGGVGDGRFDPQSNSSREQSLAIAVRMYDKIMNGSDDQNGETSENKSDEFYINMLPKVQFGEFAEQTSFDNGIKLKYKDVTREQYMQYRSSVLALFPTNMNELDTWGSAFVICSNGEYEVEINHVENILTISISSY